MQSTVLQNRPTKIVYFVVGVFCAPVLVAGIFRLIPLDWSAAVPFVSVLATAAALFWRPTSRALATGLVAGAVGWGIFLWWLVNAWSEGMRGFP